MVQARLRGTGIMSIISWKQCLRSFVRKLMEKFIVMCPIDFQVALKTSGYAEVYVTTVSSGLSLICFPYAYMLICLYCFVIFAVFNR